MSERKMAKYSKWPKQYVARIRVWDQARDVEVWEDVSMWLPLEIIEMIVEYGVKVRILETDGMDPLTLENWERICEEAGEV